VHTPAEQAAPFTQRFPHVPQLRALDERSTHAPSHDVCPASQPATHWPPAQCVFGPHAAPHAPQLRESF
jgi:hypothetical protein